MWVHKEGDGRIRSEPEGDMFQERADRHAPLAFGLRGGFGEVRAQAGNLMHQFAEVEGGDTSRPICLILLQATQQKLPDAHDRFQNPERCLRDPRTLTKEFLRRRQGHPFGEAFPCGFVIVAGDGSTTFVLLGNACAGQCSSKARVVAVDAMVDSLVASRVGTIFFVS